MLRFDFAMIGCQLFWTLDTGRVARNFLISIIFASVGITVRLSVKLYKVCKGKYKFEDIYVYPWILQVKHEQSSRDEEAQWDGKQALSPDLWLLASDLEEFLMTKTSN